MKTTKVGLQRALEIILGEKDDGVFFTVEFIKRKTGELRVMNCRGGVQKYVTGEGLKFSPNDKGLIGVWESNNKEGDKGKDAYRFISAEGVKAVVAKGIRYEVNAL